MPSDVTKPGELASFYLRQQWLLPSSEGVHVPSHILVSFVFDYKIRRRVSWVKRSGINCANM